MVIVVPIIDLKLTETALNSKRLILTLGRRSVGYSANFYKYWPLVLSTNIY